MTWADVSPYAQAIGGPLVGFIFGSVLTSYVQWGFEKKKQILLRHRELVTAWRLELLPMVASAQDSPEIWVGPKQSKVLSSPYYASLRPHLSQGAVKKIEDPTMGLVLNRGGASPSGSHWCLSISPQDFR
jgi:hypothetical protein